MKEIASIAALANRFSALPGVGRKTALRYAYAVIDMTEDEVDAFCAALRDVKSSVRLCSVCGNFTDREVCELCASRKPENIKSLIGRLSGASEVIVATNPDVEGDATAVYLARLIKPLGVKVTRIAQGISMGSELEYADAVTISQALGRRTAL